MQQYASVADAALKAINDVLMPWKLSMDICQLFQTAVFMVTFFIIFLVAYMRRDERVPLTADMAADYGAANLVVGLATYLGVSAFGFPKPYVDPVVEYWVWIPVFYGFGLMVVGRATVNALKERADGLTMSDFLECDSMFYTSFVMFAVATFFAVDCPH